MRRLPSLLLASALTLSAGRTVLAEEPAEVLTARKEFATIRDKAIRVESLGAFLTSFVGDCSSDPFNRDACQKKVEGFRSEALGKDHYVILPDDAQRAFQVHSYDPVTKRITVGVTPFFSAAGFNLSTQQPVKVDDDGNPVLPLLYVTTTLNPSQTPMDMDRLLKTGGARIQLVFRPTGVWRMPRVGLKAGMEGGRAEFRGLRMVGLNSGHEYVVGMPTTSAPGPRR